VAILVIEPTAIPREKAETSLDSECDLPEAPDLGRVKKADQFAHAIVLAILFAAPAIICVHAACANDPDIWWHLRTGEWMLQHHAVPHVDPFSVSLAGKPWPAYSWLFELLSIKLFQGFGLVGLVGYSAGMVLATTVALYHMVKRQQPDFSLAVLLTCVSVFSLNHLFTPRPWMFTILLFVLELDILMHARKTGRTRELVWLPVIFMLWANVHIEFVDGLLVLGLAWVEAIVARWWTGAQTRLRPIRLGGVLLASALATLINPYGWRVYSVVFDYTSRLATQGGALNMVSELQAIPFRDITDFLILLLALGSAAALAWRRHFSMFESALLVFAAVLSFRSQRDVWVMATVAAAIIASTITSRQKAPSRLPKFAAGLTVVVAAVAIFAGFRVMHVGNPELHTQIVNSLPARAVEVIEANGYAGPLYNDYNWGGYLIWSLRMPVSIDGRAAFYGDKSIDRSAATWNANPDWASDPALTSARLVVGPVNSALVQLLRMDPHFKLVFEDKIAAVFVART
jgi:hypothetical protein